MKSLSHPIKSVKDSAVREILPGLLLSFAIAHKLLLIDEPEVIQDLHQKLLSMDFPQTAFYLSKDNYLEVTAKHVSKEHALLEVAKYYDLPLEQVMTIGDNFNDSPMLALAGLGIAMGNAPEGVKETANLVTASNDEHGVAQAIREHVLN